MNTLAKPRMETLFVKACWEVYDQPLAKFIERCVSERWTATEIYLHDRPESVQEILRLHRTHGLKLIAQVATVGATPEEHLASLRERYQRALDCEPVAVNCHTGRDIFGFDDNRRLFQTAVELSREAGVPLLHEVHRGRALFTAPLCQAYLAAVPGLRLTADFSHLFCVHESDLSDQPAAVDAIIAATDHIHARVGFSEGPQVSDPRNPLYADWVRCCTELWSRIRDRHIAERRPLLTVTPEFGPPLYAPLEATTSLPVADPWTSNLWMRDHLRKHWE